VFTDRGPLSETLLRELSSQTALSCHDRQLMSSLAFRRGWPTQLKMFSVRGFASHKVAALCFGFAAPVTVDSATAAIGAAPKPAGSNGELRTSVISRVLKEKLIIETISEPTGNARQKRQEFW
jgi:hypothetical protein